jgi:hypothetical protein
MRRKMLEEDIILEYIDEQLDLGYPVLVGIDLSLL